MNHKFGGYNMMRVKKIILIALLILGMPINLLKADSPGEIGSEILTMTVDAKAKSLGEAYSASGDDITSMEYNPAGLSRLDAIEIGFTHFDWIADFKYEYLGIGLPLSIGTAGCSFFIFHQPAFMEMSKGHETGAIVGVSDYVITASYGIEVYDGLALGSSFKFCKRKLAEFESEIFAFDIGTIYSLKLLNLGTDLPHDKNLSFSFAAKNLGFSSKLSQREEKLPYSFMGGFALTPYKYFTLSFDLEKINKRDIFFKTGLDMMPGWYFSPRVGFNSGNDLSKFMFGAGSKFPVGRMFLYLDYAVDPLNTFGINHSFSLSIRQAPGRFEDLMKKQRLRREDVSYLVFLNFFDKSKSKDYNYLSIIIPESLSKSLDKFDYVNVVAENQMSDSEKKKLETLSESKEILDIIKFGRNLNVNGVVSGIYTMNEDILTLTIQLIDVKSKAVVLTIEKSCSVSSYIRYSIMLEEINIKISQEAEKMLK